MGQQHSASATRAITHDHSLKSFSDENLTWCSQQWKLNAALSPVPADLSDPDGKPTALSATSLRSRVARAWSSRDLIDRLGKVNFRPSAGARSRARQSEPHKVLSSFEPITEPLIEPEPEPPTSNHSDVTSSTTGNNNAAAPTGNSGAKSRTVSDVLRQTVDFLVYEVEPVLIAEHVRRSRRTSPSHGGVKVTSPLLMSTEQLRRLLTDIITDSESDEYNTFCRLLRKLDTDRETADFLEALDVVLKVVAGCTCRCCLDRRHGDVGHGDVLVPSWDVEVVYADSETRSELEYRDVETIKRCRRRKSRLTSQQRRPVVILRDTADRYVPMLSVKLSGRTLCEPAARRFERLLEHFSSVRHLALTNCLIDPPTVVRLSRVIQLNTSLYSLDLDGSRVGNDGAMLLAHALQRNKSLRMLKLSGNAVTRRGCDLLVRAIGRSRVLTELDLAGNSVGDAGCRVLAELLASVHCPLRRLTVSSNEFGVTGAAALFSALRHNSRLMQLDVSRNNITDDSSQQLMTALIYNRTLRHLAASGCNLTAETCRALARPLQTNNVLGTLVLDDNTALGDTGVEVLADSLRYNRALRQLSLRECGTTQLALSHVLAALHHNNTVRLIDLRRSTNHQLTLPVPHVPASPAPAAAADADDDNDDEDGSHGNALPSDVNAELSRLLRANPLLRILV